MGYHIINIFGSEIEHQYVKNELDIAYLDNISENTIIYQGNEEWKPIRLGNDPNFKNYAEDWFRAGLKAQELFKKHAKDHKLILEELNQDIKSFEQYNLENKKDKLKRGDFLIRNYGNLEIDIKCRSFYQNTNDDLVFNFKYADYKKHLNMQKETQTPILIAVYKRDGDKVIDDTPYFFSLENLDKNKLNVVDIKAFNTGKCFQIPLKKTVQNFDFIKNYISNRS
ncbi:hypothetical protein [Daejeonella sp.]|uniref:hypothetical protein n=1 Tax=Daejeonella sp. TaxID=2805397 RepID=UPI0025BC30E7|nr:hypothetical protein [Daejeonella sp.]